MTRLRIRTVISHWLPVFLFCLLIFIQSGRPAPEALPALPMIDKLLHGAAFAALSMLIYRALHLSLSQNRAMLGFWLSVCIASLYGLSDEIHQTVVPQREADPLDVIADIIGSLIGAAFYHRFLHRHLREAEQPD